MGKTYYQIIAFYDGNKTAREIMTDVIVRKVRKNLAENIEKSYGKEYTPRVYLDYAGDFYENNR